MLVRPPWRPPARPERYLRLALVLAPLTWLFVVLPLSPALLAGLGLSVPPTAFGLGSGVVVLLALGAGIYRVRA